MKTITMPLEEYRKDIEYAELKNNGVYYHRGVLDTIEMLTQRIKYKNSECEFYNEPYLNLKVKEFLDLIQE